MVTWCHSGGETSNEPAVSLMVTTINRPHLATPWTTFWRGIGRALEECDDDLWAFVSQARATSPLFGRGSEGRRARRRRSAGDRRGGMGFRRLRAPSDLEANRIPRSTGSLLVGERNSASRVISSWPPRRPRRTPGGSPRKDRRSRWLRLVEQLSKKVAMEMLLTGKPISAEQALAWCFVDRDRKTCWTPPSLFLAIFLGAPVAVQASKRIAVGIVDGHVPADELRSRGAEGSACIPLTPTKVRVAPVGHVAKGVR